MSEGLDASGVQRQIDELVALVAANHAQIDELQRQAADSQARADAAELRADEMEARSRIDREMLAELQADGTVSREHVQQLETALATSRTIGAAIGVLMGSRNISQDEAFEVLKGVSSRTNTKLRDVAQTLVSRG